MCVAIAIAFVAYLVAATYGVYHLRDEGLELKHPVKDTSYYHRYLMLMDQHFPTKLPVGFVAVGTMAYSGREGRQFLRLLEEARRDPEMRAGFQRCWLSSYANSIWYNPSAPVGFVSNLKTFLAVTPDFQADVILDDINTSVIASCCFVMSETNRDQYARADLMGRMCDPADASSLPVFAYHSSFMTFEQSLAVLPATLLIVGCAVAVMTVVIFLFLPHIFMVLLVFLTIVMIVVGIFGFVYFWDLTLSSIIMTHLVMSVGFSVDFSAHVCAAYLISDSKTREERARDAIRHAAGPVLNLSLIHI